MPSIVKAFILSIWLGLLVGVIDTVVVAGLQLYQIHVRELQASWWGWLQNQGQNVYLNLIGYQGMGLAAGLVTLVIVSSYLLFRRKAERTPASTESLFFTFMLGLLLFVISTAVSLLIKRRAIYIPGFPALWVWAIYILMLILSFFITIGFYRKLERKDVAIWLHATALFAAGFLFLSLLVRYAFSENLFTPLYHLSLYALVVLVVCWGLYRLFTFLFKKVSSQETWRFAAVIVSMVALGLLLIGFVNPYKSPPQKKAGGENKPNIILIVLDTVRADHLSVYGYDRPTTPVLERMASEGVLFENAFATGPWTIPSHASFFTGLYPGVHRCTHERLWLDRDHLTLAEQLRDRGYVTLGYSNNPLVGRLSKLDAGFDRFVEGWELKPSIFVAAGLLYWFFPEVFPADAGAATTWRRVDPWLHDLSGSGSPFFIFINYMEAHHPYTRHPEAMVFFSSEKRAYERLRRIKIDFHAWSVGRGRINAQKSATIKTLYDGEIHYLDSQVGKILDTLEETGLDRNTAVIVMSDHGELFGAHGVWGHDRTLYHPLIHVPLIVRFPGTLPKGKRVQEPMSLITLPQIVLALQEGKGMNGLMSAATPENLSSQGLMAEVMRPIRFMAIVKDRFPGHDVDKMDRRQKALIRYPWKLVWDSKGEDMLYNIKENPAETSNKRREHYGRYHRMMMAVDEYRAAIPEPGEPEPMPPMDPQTRKRLRALGYVP